MKVFGALENANLELLTAAPSVTPTSRMYFDTTVNTPKIYLGAAWAALMVIGVQTVTTGSTVTSSADTYICNAASATFTMTLVAASSCPNKVYRFKKLASDTSRNVVTIQAAGSDKIDNQATQTISNPGDVLTLVSDGTQWHLI